MKKTLLLAVSALVAICAQAQLMPVMKIGNAVQLRDPMAMTVGNRCDTPAPSRAADVAKAPNLADNERLLGLYTSDDYMTEGYGLFSLFSTVPLELPMGTIIPASLYSQKFVGGKITSIRFAMAAACTVSSVQVYDVTEKGAIKKVVDQPLTTPSVKAGWTTVKLDTPYELSQSTTAIMIGYTFRQTSNSYPVSLYDGAKAEEGWLFYGNPNGGSGEGWYDMSGYGMLSVQAIVQCDNLPAVDIVLGNMETERDYYLNGDEMNYRYSAYNFGTAAVETYEINVKIDGQTVQTVTEKDVAIAANKDFYVGSFKLPADIAVGRHSLSAEVVKANGSPITEFVEDGKDTAFFRSARPSDVVARQKYLIEEFTSHSCTYCPYGTALLEKMMKRSNDLAVVCIHGNQSQQDPYNTAQCEALMAQMEVSAFPSAAFNRVDFGEQDGGVATPIGYNPNYQDQAAQELLEAMEYLSAPSLASVDIQKTLDGNALTIEVSGKGGEAAKEVLEDFALMVYVVEDSLVNRQLNLGTWVQKYVHRHVLRRVVTALNGDAINWTSDSEYHNTFSVTLPTTWVKDHLSVVAFLCLKQPLTDADLTSMSVTNANVLELKETSSGIQVVDADAASAVTYNLWGMPCQDGRTGLRIVRKAGSGAATLQMVVE